MIRTISVKVEYQFQIETNKTAYRDIEAEAETYWNSISGIGLEGKHYHDTEINVEP